ELKLNEGQLAAYNKLSQFMNSAETNFLLLGSAGSGKTTTIVKTFSKSKYSIVFCAFTNKATSVLLQISKKFKLNFKAEFATIHTLLRLKPTYQNDRLIFQFDKERLQHLVNIDVIVFDECSTISKELYIFIKQAYKYIRDEFDKELKFIFLGDFWQIPPVGERSSVVFSLAKTNKWPISKLTKVMRSNNQTIYNINVALLTWIELFKDDKESLKLKKLIGQYPLNLVKRSTCLYLDSCYQLANAYFNKRSKDCIILTHSRKSCDDINLLVQSMINDERILNGQTDIIAITDAKSIKRFYPGDKCCLDRPISLSKLRRVEHQNIALFYDEISTNDVIINQCEELEAKLYNGEVFDVVCSEDVLINNLLSKHTNTFKGQLLTIKRICNDEMFEIVFIPNEDILNACAIIKSKFNRNVYNQIMSDFNKTYALLNYGYCMTIYKSQGSQWETVFINLQNIWWSICGQSENNHETRLMLFKITYTALSRASDEIVLFWK
ncbi:hypothetical protein EBX93_15795, partial [bacterium]|nr:hypothetical protein [bacterium]